jgi:hypothetical protein
MQDEFFEINKAHMLEFWEPKLKQMVAGKYVQWTQGEMHVLRRYVLIRRGKGA